MTEENKEKTSQPKESLLPKETPQPIESPLPKAPGRTETGMFDSVENLRTITIVLTILLLIATMTFIFDEVLEDDDDDDNHGGSSWTTEFRKSDYDFASNGSNPFFILEPGYQIVLEGEEDGETLKVQITILNETQVVDGVETRVVEEKEWEGGEIVEISRNFFAIDTRTNSVFYFGETVDDYEGGEVVDHSGEWLSGVDGATFGLIMPGLPMVGARYYQEYAPGVALDRGTIKSVKETVETPMGTFENCLFIMDSSGLEPDEADPKYFAPGIGIIQDEEVKVTSYGYI